MDGLELTIADQLLFTDPETGDKLRLKYEPQKESDGCTALYVTNKNADIKFKHTIKTERI